jgi:hypothetical protein
LISAVGGSAVFPVCGTLGRQSFDYKKVYFAKFAMNPTK